MLEINPTRWFWLILADLTVFNHSSGLDRQVFSSKGLQFFMRGIGWIVQYKTYPSAATSGLTWGLHHSNKLAMRGFSENHTFFRIPKQDSKNIHTPPNFEKQFSSRPPNFVSPSPLKIDYKSYSIIFLRTMKRFFIHPPSPSRISRISNVFHTPFPNWKSQFF